MNWICWCLLILSYSSNAIGFKFSNRNIKWKPLRTKAAPYLDSLASAAMSISTRKRFFFPGHKGGCYVSNKFNNVLQVGDSALILDLPELDELDNLHCPEVSMYMILSCFLFHV